MQIDISTLDAGSAGMAELPEEYFAATPRADAADVTGASVPTRVQDVHWREVPAAPKAPAPRQQP